MVIRHCVKEVLAKKQCCAAMKYIIASKLRPVKTFKGEKCNFTGETVIAQPPSVTGGAIYDKHPTLTTSAW